MKPPAVILKDWFALDAQVVDEDVRPLLNDLIRDFLGTPKARRAIDYYGREQVFRARLAYLIDEGLLTKSECVESAAKRARISTRRGWELLADDETC